MKQVNLALSVMFGWLILVLVVGCYIGSQVATDRELLLTILTMFAVAVFPLEHIERFMMRRPKIRRSY